MYKFQDLKAYLTLCTQKKTSQILWVKHLKYIANSTTETYWEVPNYPRDHHTSVTSERIK